MGVMSIEEYMKISEQFDTELPKAEDYLEIVKNLEEEFSEVGLKFSNPFHSAFPMVADGTVNDCRFTFRLRGDIVRLLVFNTIADEVANEPSRSIIINGLSGHSPVGWLETDEAEVLFRKLMSILFM